MWEININSTQNGKVFLQVLYENIIQVLKKYGAIVVLGSDHQSLSIGCNQENSEQVWNKVKRALCDLYCNEIKRDFLNSHIKNLELGESQKDAFINVLTYFDSELEKQIVFRSLKYTKTIVLESFFNFRLRPLKQKWKELCNLTNNNMDLILKNNNFLEIMKFFVGSIKPKNDCVVVSYHAPCVVFNDKMSRVVAVDSFEKSDIFSLVAFLVSLAPNKIKLLCDSFSNEQLNIFREIFGQKVEIIK